MNSSIHDPHHTHALPYPQVHKVEVGSRLIHKRYEYVTSGVQSKGHWYTVYQVADMLGYSPATIYRYVRDGVIRAYQNYRGCGIRISQQFIDEFRSSKHISKKQKLHLACDIAGDG